jgi:hypothetical protein
MALFGIPLLSSKPATSVETVPATAVIGSIPEPMPAALRPQHG